MGGLLITSIVSGQVIARTGRYKVFPILGTAVACLGMYLLSSLDETTSTGVAAFHMLILGLGLGMVMQVLVLVVQNSVPYDMLGVATSGSTLFRSIGGSLGTAILGAIFTGRLAAEVASGDTQVHAFTDSLHVVFLVAAGVVVIAFALSWLIPEAPLRKTVDATVVGDTIGGPVDTDSLRELTRALSRAAGRDRTLAFMQRVTDRADAGLSPAASWALLRLGAPEAPSVADLAALPHVRSERLAAAMGELRDGDYVAGERVTPTGVALRDRLVAARTEGLRELISEWEPDRFPELDGLVRRLADELVPVPA
jgi:MFS family permease